jgi:hypothetical protein
MDICWPWSASKRSNIVELEQVKEFFPKQSFRLLDGNPGLGLVGGKFEGVRLFLAT